MPLLELNLDSFAKIQSDLKVPGVDPVMAAGIAEIAGADSVGITSTEGESRHARLILETTQTRFNWHVPITDKAIEAVMTHPPDMVTFIDHRRDGDCVDLRGASDLKQVFSQVRPVKSMAVSVRIAADVKQLKRAYKLGADYVEINSWSYVNASTQEERLEALENISGVARIAYKYEIGVIVSGGLNYQNFRDIAELESVETIVVGRAILGKSLFIGLENALRDFIFLVK
ncbi:MAG: pyridoxine 5'-phosphate synthase [Candidatus Marinimicrobia bacterium]|nr:pyridoxine 5'-phosphate synthase [Candidatus Neomarinimicrobiota bacterium]MCF7829082.1 pyridoxine 5'-phosphate synthase [Candidatus Neomarinimicrobiota bacterium]MCF7881519.1 pyridoxine 5'-phosphate synthase [Candidatus Neomarinimicrobiota bacterium]